MRKGFVFLILVASSTACLWARPAVRFQEVAGGLVFPVAIAHAGDGTGRLFVLELEGRVRILHDGEIEARPFLDITSRVLQDGEGGLVGLAFHPNFHENRRFFLFYSSQGEDGIESVLAEYRANPADAGVAEPEEKRLLVFDHPTSIHFGGDLVFGPDGYLYVSSGDGGDPERPEVAQAGDNYLGKILRIDVDGGEPYGIPPDNPFLGDADFLPEIWALGFRNPWRMAIDRRTGELFAADVGTVRWEEVNRVKPGRNYGWPRTEGFGCRPAVECDLGEFEPPVFAYDHRDSGGVAAVIGGPVYLGRSPELYGALLASDFVSNRTWEVRDGADGWTAREIGRESLNLSAYGEDESGEIYALDFNRGRVVRMEVGFAVGFAQVGSGPYPGGRLVSELALSNPWDRDVQVRLRSYAPDGEALAFRIGGEEASVFEWTLPAQASRTFRLDAVEGLQTGWLSLRSDREVGATLRMEFLDEQGTRLAALGLEPSPEVCEYVVEGRLNAEAGVSAGLAVANPFRRDMVEAVVELLDGEGLVMASQEVQLEGLRQWAQVLESIAPDLESLEGTIRVRSDRPLLVTTVGTARGLPGAAVRGSGSCGPPLGSITRGREFSP